MILANDFDRPVLLVERFVVGLLPVNALSDLAKGAGTDAVLDTVEVPHFAIVSAVQVRVSLVRLVWRSGIAKAKVAISIIRVHLTSNCN